jgi:PBP1b-binding outer membrane lipoprotein LpoB
MEMRYGLLAMMLLALCACPQRPEPAPPPSEEQAGADASKNQNDTQLRDTIQAPIEKANAVEGQVLDGADKQKADIEGAGG